ncbi:MAG: YafY family protein [Legionellaceae bacterium]|nr:YafY family protein [Legionellaceae bacterium]
MSRTQRLFDLIQILRRHRYPVTGQQLADELAISLRTLYRDIATLQTQGASIEGSPGMGYILQPGFTLPPLMFSEEEIEALVLGSRWVAHRTDKKLRAAAVNVLAKISAVLSDDLRYQLEFSGLLIGPSNTPIAHDDEQEALIRYAIRKAYKLHITYVDVKQEKSERIIWPIALGFFEERHVTVAWCELRENFRHFRTDRMIKLTQLDAHYPKPRHLLLKEWRDIHHIPEQ